MREIACALTLSVMVPLLARAAPTPAARRACIEAHRDAQLKRRAGRIDEARQRLRACSASACPAPVRVDCATWLVELDGTAAPASAASAAADPPSAPPAPAPPAPVRSAAPRPELPTSSAAKAEDAGRPAARLVPASLGALALGLTAAGTALAWTGRSRERALSRSCMRRCSEEAVAGVRRRYLAADLSFGAAVVGAAAALWLWVRAPTQPDAGRAEAEDRAPRFVGSGWTPLGFSF